MEIHNSIFDLATCICSSHNPFFILLMQIFILLHQNINEVLCAFCEHSPYRERANPISIQLRHNFIVALWAESQVCHKVKSTKLLRNWIIDCNLSKQQTSWSVSAMRMGLFWGLVGIFSSCTFLFLKVFTWFIYMYISMYDQRHVIVI